MFQYNPFALPPLFSALLIITIGSYVLVRNPQSEKHRSLFYFCLSCFIWLIFYTGIYLSREPEQVVKFAQLANIGIVFIPLTNLYFNTRLINGKKDGFLIILLVLTVIFVCLTFTDRYYVGATKYFWGFYPKAGLYQHPFLCLYIGIWLYGLRILHWEMNKKKLKGDIVAYQQIRNVYIAWFGGSLGVVDFLPKYGIPIYPFAYMVALYWVFISSLAILQNHLSKNIYLSSRMFLINSFYIFLLTFLSYITYIIAQLFKDIFFITSIYSAYIAIALMLGAILKPLYDRVESAVNSIFFIEYYQRTQKLSKLTQNLLISENIDNYNKGILFDISGFFKITKISLYLWNDERKDYQLQNALNWGRFENVDTTKNILGESTIIKYMLTNRYLYIDDVYLADIGHEYKSNIISWMSKNNAKLCLPIRKDNIIGFLMLGEKESGLSYNRHEIDELLKVLEFLSIVIKRNSLIESQAQMSEALNTFRDISMRDSMTNLYNHKKSREMLASIIKDSVAHNFKCFVLILDIDKFKDINDTYGHPVGDKVIVDLSNIIKKNMPSCDYSFSGRMGGEEFIIVLGNKSLSYIKRFTSDLMTDIRASRIHLHRSLPIVYTVSVGVTATTVDLIDPDQLILIADEMMYTAKKKGRNRVVFSDKNTINV